VRARWAAFTTCDNFWLTAETLGLHLVTTVPVPSAKEPPIEAAGKSDEVRHGRVKLAVNALELL
jgi:hypothetical protein